MGLNGPSAYHICNRIEWLPMTAHGWTEENCVSASDLGVVGGSWLQRLGSDHKESVISYRSQAWSENEAGKNIIAVV